MGVSLVRQELGLLGRVRGLWILVSLLLALALVAAASGYARVSARTAVAAGLMADEQLLRDSLRAGLKRFEASKTVGDQDIPVGAKPGALGFSVLSEYVVQPEPPLSALAVGVSDLLPHYYRLNAHAAHTLSQTSSIENPLHLRVGGFDLAFVMVFLLPIIVIALSYDIMSREKELGVLALVGAQGVALSTFIGAKVVARGLLIAVAIVVANLLAIGVLVWLGSSVDFSAAALWIALAVVYGLFWFSIAVLVNALGLASATNGVVLANLWLIFLVVLPAVVNLAATSLYPAPSRVSLTTELREAASEAEERAAAAREQYFFDHPDMAGGDVDQEVFFREVAASEADIARSIEPQLAEFQRQAEQQARLVGRLKYLSPALLADHLFAAIAGTDRQYHEAFRRATFEFHSTWREFFVSRLRNDQPMTVNAWQSLPVFDYRPPDLFSRGETLTNPLLTLLILVILVVVVALVRYRRYSHV